jgi:hypothetical protein
VLISMLIRGKAEAIKIVTRDVGEEKDLCRAQHPPDSTNGLNIGGGPNGI